MRRGFWDGGGIGCISRLGKECMAQITNVALVSWPTAKKVST